MTDRGQPVASGTILIVDDEPEVRRVLSATLSMAGFRVLVADSGDAGLELFRQNRPEINLVLTDVVMPGISGVEMVAKILESDPDMRILLMSAYKEPEPLVSSKRRYPFIRKPFLPPDLVRRVRGVLGQAAAAE